MEVREVQLMNASSPMEVTLSGITRETREEQPENAVSSIDMTLSGTVYAL